MIHPNTYKKVYFQGAKGLIFIGDKILTYRRDNKTDSHPLCIDLPGGGREGDESPFETFAREAKEEFGVSIKKNNIVFSCTVKSIKYPDRESYFIVAKPLNLKTTDVVFGDEGTEWQLMTPEEFISRSDGIEKQQKRVLNYLSGKMVSE